MPTYIFKPGPELAWFVIVLLATVLMQAVVTQGATPPTDMGAWLIGLAVAAVRAVLGALLQTGSKTDDTAR